MSSFLCVLFLLVNPPPAMGAASVSHFAVPVTRDVRLLPYRVDLIFSGGVSPGAPLVCHPWRVFSAAESASDSVVILATSNQPESSDLPSMVELLRYPERLPLEEHPIWLTVTDAGVWERNGEPPKGLWFAGYAQDSAWVCLVNGAAEPGGRLFLAAGTDSTGDAVWRCALQEVGAFDYDFDGAVEHFFYLDPERGLRPRYLYCVEPAARRIEWGARVSSPLPLGCIVPCGDSADAGILAITYAPGQGASDSLFSDSFGYLVRLDRAGAVRYRKIVSRYSEATGLVPAADASGWYILHTLPLVDSVASGDLRPGPSVISRIDRDFRVVKSIAMPDRVQYIFPADYDRDGAADLYAVSHEGVIRIFGADLTLKAESDSSYLQYRGQMTGWPGADTVLFFQERDTGGVYTPQFEKLAAVPTSDYRDVFAYDDRRRVAAILGADRDRHFIGYVRKSTFMEAATAFYVDYQAWVLAALSSLLVGVAVLGAFRHRLSRRKQELESAHRKLAQAYADLRAAQEKIVAQEKYRQAKDIAGGFAHEIKNALFPVDGALLRQEKLLREPAPDSARLRSTHATIRSAITRAVNLTRQITEYSRLEAEIRPEPADVRAILGEVLAANAAPVEERAIGVAAEGEAAAVAAVRAGHLRSAFTNLLMNSVEALEGRDTPRITIAWTVRDRRILLEWTDNGCGIAESDLPRIFDAFFSTKPTTGTGLGLSLVKRIVELYGGSIAAESRPGKGTAFHLVLPMIPEQSG
ncbi:MAG TPA: HAMP domain-containing sensor histidine kinase [candidate division Zixibacteria bacterium]|nr:HAMP domain-containing sensor histidine kinase [candidate division Zixibacteria bacterium]